MLNTNTQKTQDDGNIRNTQVPFDILSHPGSCSKLGSKVSNARALWLKARLREQQLKAKLQLEAIESEARHKREMAEARYATELARLRV